MNLTNLTPEELISLREIATKMKTNLEELLKEHQDVSALIEAHKSQNFGMLNEYEKNDTQILND